jgi:hypothetical protein
MDYASKPGGYGEPCGKDVLEREIIRPTGSALLLYQGANADLVAFAETPRISRPNIDRRLAVPK